MINIAIMGYGVVGRGVAAVFADNAGIITKRAGEEIKVKYILDLLDFPGDINEKKVTHDFDVILGDPEVSIVAETMGGKRVAYKYTKALLEAGKSVVTSNKELVAAYGDELLAIAAEKGVRYMFEASVGGGIPVLTPMCDSLAANEINSICGIVNGTSNYILTEMKRGEDFAAALADAQKKGYAEANPSADIEGADACRKLCILAALAYGVLFEPESVPTRGISDITLADIEDAAREGCVVKLIARAARLSDGRLSLMVAPFKLPLTNPLANIEGVYNGILINGNEVGDVMFYGQGAGSLPTASAVAADIMYITTHANERPITGLWTREPSRLAKEITSPDDLEAMYSSVGYPLFAENALK